VRDEVENHGGHGADLKRLLAGYRFDPKELRQFMRQLFRNEYAREQTEMTAALTSIPEGERPAAMAPPAVAPPPVMPPHPPPVMPPPPPPQAIPAPMDLGPPHTQPNTAPTGAPPPPLLTPPDDDQDDKPKSGFWARLTKRRR
jgi:hypothetical protein